MIHIVSTEPWLWESAVNSWGPFETPAVSDFSVFWLSQNKMNVDVMGIFIILLQKPGDCRLYCVATK